jgi:tellurite resistance protein
MTTISSHALQSSRSEQAIKASKSWSLRSLQIAQQALKENGDQVTDSASATCARAKTVGLQNMGMLAEVSRLLLNACQVLIRQIEGDKNGALKYFNQALEAAKDTSFAEARREATQAIRRLGASSDSA